MKLSVSANEVNSELTWIALLPQAATDFRPKQGRDAHDNAVPKLTDSGQPIFRAELSAVAPDREGKPRVNRDASLGVLHPVDVQAGTPYVLSGSVVVTHYVTGSNRLGVSIIADSLVPARSAEK